VKGGNRERRRRIYVYSMLLHKGTLARVLDPKP
jgi:hypothetical protein